MNLALKSVSEHCAYFDMPAKAGLILLDASNVILIDTGNDVSAAKKIKKVLDEKGWYLQAIYNTHSNADHIGGNAWLARQYACAIYTTDMEACFTRHPILEPAFLYGGYPFEDLRHKFLMAKPSDALPLSDKNLPSGLEPIRLDGHFLEMIGFAYPAEEVVYLADCLSSAATLKKYRISFIFDVEAYLQTLEKIKSIPGQIFIPAHTPVLYSREELIELADLNIANTLSIGEDILDILETPKTFDEILQELFNRYQLSLNAEQYVLCGSTIRSFLSWLKDQKKIRFSTLNNLFVWEKES